MFSKKPVFTALILSSISLFASAHDEKISTKDQEKMVQRQMRHVLYKACDDKDAQCVKTLNKQVHARLINEHMVLLQTKKQNIVQMKKNKFIAAAIYLTGTCITGLISYDIKKKLDAGFFDVSAVHEVINKAIGKEDEVVTDKRKTGAEMCLGMSVVVSFYTAAKGLQKLYEGIFYEKVLDQKIARDEKALQLLN